MTVQIYRLLEENYTEDLFRSEVSHLRAHTTDRELVKIILTYNMVEVFWKKQWYFKAFYILALLDYLSDKHHAPYYAPYEKYRKYKLETLAYPSSILFLERLNTVPDAKARAITFSKSSDYGRHFLKYNIIESEEEEGWQ